MTSRRVEAPARRYLGLTPLQLVWPTATALLLLVFNKLVVHDDGSFFGTVLLVGFALGLVGVFVVRLASHRSPE